MFLHFNKANLILGVDMVNHKNHMDDDDDNDLVRITGYFVQFIKTNEYEYEKNQYLFDEWKIEQATNSETFYLVFKNEKKENWYLSEFNKSDCFDKHDEYFEHLCQMQNKKAGAIKFCFNDEKTKIKVFENDCFIHEKYYLTFDETDLLLCLSLSTADEFTCVCLTENLNNNRYVLK